MTVSLGTKILVGVRIAVPEGVVLRVWTVKLESAVACLGVGMTGGSKRRASKKVDKARGYHEEKRLLSGRGTDGMGKTRRVPAEHSIPMRETQHYQGRKWLPHTVAFGTQDT